MRPRFQSLRVLFPTGLAALTIIFGETLVSAHAQFVNSTPAANASVSSLPDTLQVTYSEELASVHFTITGPDGSNAAAAAPACVDNGVRTPGINDARVDTYCKRQAIRNQNQGKIDERTFNYDLSIGIGLQTALNDAMKALKGGG